MGVFPMVLWKNSSSIRSEFTKRSEGRRRSSFPNLEMRKGTRQPRRGPGATLPWLWFCSLMCYLAGWLG